MGFSRFEIVLDPELPVYIAGQELKGYLKVSTLESIECRSITLWVKGSARVRWSKSRGKKRRTYSAKEQYFCNEIVLWSGAESGNIFHTSSFRFPFAFTLPPNIPSSFSSPNGDVVYKVKAQADLPSHSDQHTQKLFSVNFLYDLNQDPDALKAVCRLCCAEGPITLTMRAQRTGYVPGETVVVNGELHNGSSATLKYTELRLEQLITYIARSNTHKVWRTVHRVYHPQLAGGQRDVWSAVPLPIPAVPASHLLHCNLITIDYILTFKGKLGKGKKAKVTAPVIIGTLPLRGTYSTFHSPSPAHFGSTSLATSVSRSGRNSPAHFDGISPNNSLRRSGRNSPARFGGTSPTGSLSRSGRNSPARFGGTSPTGSLSRSGRNSPAPFNPSSPLPPIPSVPSPYHSPTAPPVPPHRSPTTPPVPPHQSPTVLLVPPHQSPTAPPVPPHRPYSDPPPPYTSLLPPEYKEIPPPSYAACTFGIGATGSGGGGSDESDEAEFAPQYLTYRTNT